MELEEELVDLSRGHVVVALCLHSLTAIRNVCRATPGPLHYSQQREWRQKARDQPQSG
ncbi:hypothetical protein BaRGS_00027421, partial [Batillaria attramentaria]